MIIGSHTSIFGRYLRNKTWTFAVAVKSLATEQNWVPALPLCVCTINIDLYFSVQDTRASDESIVILCPFYQACRTFIMACENVTMWAFIYSVWTEMTVPVPWTFLTIERKYSFLIAMKNTSARWLPVCGFVDQHEINKSASQWLSGKERQHI